MQVSCKCRQCFEDKVVVKDRDRYWIFEANTDILSHFLLTQNMVLDPLDPFFLVNNRIWWRHILNYLKPSFSISAAVS